MNQCQINFIFVFFGHNYTNEKLFTNIVTSIQNKKKLLFQNYNLFVDFLIMSVVSFFYLLLRKTIAIEVLVEVFHFKLAFIVQHSEFRRIEYLSMHKTTENTCEF